MKLTVACAIVFLVFTRAAFAKHEKSLPCRTKAANDDNPGTEDKSFFANRIFSFLLLDGRCDRPDGIHRFLTHLLFKGMDEFTPTAADPSYTRQRPAGSCFSSPRPR